MRYGTFAWQLDNLEEDAANAVNVWDILLFVPVLIQIVRDSRKEAAELHERLAKAGEERDE